MGKETVMKRLGKEWYGDFFLGGGVVEGEGEKLGVIRIGLVDGETVCLGMRETNGFVLKLYHYD